MKIHPSSYIQYYTEYNQQVARQLQISCSPAFDSSESITVQPLKSPQPKNWEPI